MIEWVNRLASLVVAAPEPAPTQTRSLAGVEFIGSEFPSMEQQMAAVFYGRRQAARPWRGISVGEALGVPAILGAVSLIADTVGSMSLEAYRRGVKMSEPDIPRITQRPDPFHTPRVFFRDSAFHLCTRGECWWWVAARDPFDNAPQSLYVVPPWEVVVEQNDRNRLQPTIRWQDRVMRNEDMRQITYLPGQGGRGVGPLQIAGAAVSIAVEADAYAANFFGGGIPSMIGHTDMDLDEEELKALDRQWNEKPPNMPRWMTSGITIDAPPFDAQKAQMTESRQHQVGEVARMFNMPGALIEYNMPGASLRYQNDQTIWTDFQRRCLSPHYLEPIEQEMSDLLPRSTVARFNLEQLLRSDAKTRAEFYEKTIPLGVIPVEEAQRREGVIPGSIDYAPVPAALPQAVPTIVPPDQGLRVLPPDREVLTAIHCPNGHLVGRVAGAAEIKCSRCKRMAVAS